MNTLKAGSLAYYDSFGGMVKVRILSIIPLPEYPRWRKALLRVLSRGDRNYKCGETITLEGSLTSIVPRNIRWKRGTYHQRYITPAFEVLCDD